MAGYATISIIYAVQSMLPELARAFAIPEGSTSLVISMTTGPMAVLILGAGPLAERFGRRPLIWQGRRLCFRGRQGDRQ